jgi:hypothetical protein
VLLPRKSRGGQYPIAGKHKYYFPEVLTIVCFKKPLASLDVHVQCAFVLGWTQTMGAGEAARKDS